MTRPCNIRDPKRPTTHKCASDVGHGGAHDFQPIPSDFFAPELW